MDCLHYPGAGHTLLVMLPGVGIEPREFAEQGMIETARLAAPGLDIIAARPDLALYLEDTVAEALEAEVLAPARARGIARIWLLGISLGGMGALLCAQARPGAVEGLFLLAPFLGTRGTVAELRRAGGLMNWSPGGSTATPAEQRLLLWLQDFLRAEGEMPALYLGYAAQDRFAPAHKLLAARLPPGRVAMAPGGHDWPSWRALWRQLAPRAAWTLP